jgi:hypothetical protein
VLIVCLVLLIALTFLATVGAATARSQIRLIRNHIGVQRAFTAAEAGVTAFVRDPALGGADEETRNLTVDGSADVEVTLSYQGTTNIPDGGYSLGGNMRAFHYEIESSAVTGDGAGATHVQGIYLVGPGQ